MSELRTQSRHASLWEAVVNTLVGYVIAYVATAILFRIYDIPASQGKIHSVTMWMTLISILRGYVLRRAWNAEFWTRLNWRRPWRLFRLRLHSSQKRRYPINPPPLHPNCRCTVIPLQSDTE